MSTRQTSTASAKGSFHPTGAAVTHGERHASAGQDRSLPEEGDDEAIDLVEAGITAADIAVMQANLKNHSITYKDVLGLSAGEMEAMEYRANELLRQNHAGRALKIFVALTKLDRFQARYFRGAGMAFQYMRNYGMAYGAYDLALATDPSDRISEALRAESLVFVMGKAAGAAALDTLLSKGPARPHEEPYIKRAVEIRQRLR